MAWPGLDVQGLPRERLLGLKWLGLGVPRRDSSSGSLNRSSISRNRPETGAHCSELDNVQFLFHSDFGRGSDVRGLGATRRISSGPREVAYLAKLGAGKTDIRQNPSLRRLFGVQQPGEANLGPTMDAPHSRHRIANSPQDARKLGVRFRFPGSLPPSLHRVL